MAGSGSGVVAGSEWGRERLSLMILGRVVAGSGWGRDRLYLMILDRVVAGSGWGRGRVRSWPDRDRGGRVGYDFCCHVDDRCFVNAEVLHHLNRVVNL